MLKYLKSLFSPPAEDAAGPQQLERAVAILLHEVARMDAEVREEDVIAAQAALRNLLGVDEGRAQALLAQASQERVTSYHTVVSAINRAFDMERRVHLVEHLWRVAHADDSLHLHEDHLVRKLADLMHVSNTQSMLARQRARAGQGG